MFGCVEINSGFNGFLLEWVDNGSNGCAIRSGGLRPPQQAVIQLLSDLVLRRPETSATDGASV